MTVSWMGLFGITFVLIPFAWAGIVALTARGQPLEDGAEKWRLALMLAPVVIGTLMICGAALWPYTPATSAALVALAGGDGGAQSGQMAPSVAREGALPLIPMAVGLYALGVALMAARLVKAWLQLTAVVARAVPTPNAAAVRMTDQPISPFVGPGNVVVLPTTVLGALSEAQCHLIIAHEQAHIARRDPVYFSVLAWIDVVFWLNPFIRQQTENCRAAAELAVDARIVAAAPQMRKTYAKALVTVLQHTAGNALHGVPAVFSARNKGVARMRINQIMRTRPHPRKRYGAMAAAAALILPLTGAQWALAAANMAASADFVMLPLTGKVSSHYGEKPNPKNGRVRHHRGIDIIAPMGTKIVAPAAARVQRVAYADVGYGNVLELDHGDNTITRYAHLEGIDVAVGDRVRAGQAVARVGSSGQSTGPHLHLEVLVDGKRVDPASVLDFPAGH